MVSYEDSRPCNSFFTPKQNYRVMKAGLPYCQKAAMKPSKLPFDKPKTLLSEKHLPTLGRLKINVKNLEKIK